MPKRTLADVMQMHGITRPQLDALKQKGVNVWNDVDTALALGKTRHRINPAAKLPSTAPAAKAETLEEIEDAVRKSRDLETIKILKEKLQALKIAVAVRVETRELVAVGEVRQSMTRICSAARGELLKLSSDLPPRLAGLSEPKMQKIIRDAVHEILLGMSDETNAIYRDVVHEILLDMSLETNAICRDA